MQLGFSTPIVQQVPGRAASWEANAGVAEILRIAQAADRLGYAWLTCSDHVAVPDSHVATMGATWYEPSTTLAFLAAATERIRLLCHVLVLPYRHPLVVAKTFATLDQLSGGRVIIGTGTGHIKAEFRSLGIDHAQRADMSDEYLQALTVALEQPTSSFRGRWVEWRDMVVAPRPRQTPRPPIWAGGNSAAAAERAALHADGWVPWQLEPAQLQERVAVAHEVRERAGRTASFEVVAPCHVGRAETAEGVLQRLRAWQTAGATRAHVGFESSSSNELLERMEFVQKEVAPLLDSEPA
jgi:probable F420-dependent oxidoreductase